MNRIDKLFNKKNKDIISIFYPAGYPNINDTLNILNKLESNGIDMVEIGIPYSDPLADGKVIQDASAVALRNGISLKRIFEQLENMRQNVSIPIILMGYLNPIMQYGFVNFCKKCAKIGIDGVIIPDLPYNEYIQEYKEIADRYNINIIMLITPQTNTEKILVIDENTSGFIYMVSGASVTGAQTKFGDTKIEYFKRLNSLNLKNNRLIGFGVSNKETFKNACEYSSGAIIGSHFVKLLEQEESIDLAISKLISSLHS